MFLLLQCLHRRARKLGLGPFWKFAQADDEHPASHFLRICCLLPRLPPNAILEGYRYVRDLLDNIPAPANTKCFKFCAYLFKNWINKSPQDLRELSVYGHGVAATSGLESINRKLNTIVGDRHPHFWKFLGKSVTLQKRWGNLGAAGGHWRPLRAARARGWGGGPVGGPGPPCVVSPQSP